MGVQSQHDVNLLRRFFLQFKLEINTLIRHLTRAVLVLPKNFLHCDKNRNKLVFASPSSENTTSLCRILIACSTSALIVYFFNLVYKKHSPRYKLRKFWFCALLGFYIAWAVILICGCILSWCMFLLWKSSFTYSWASSCPWRTLSSAN